MSLSFPSDLLQAREYVCQISALKPLNNIDENLRGRIRGDSARASGGIERREIVSSIYVPVPINLTQGVQEHEIDTQANLLGAIGDTLQNIVQIGNRVGAAVQRSINIGHYIVYQAPKFKQVEYTWTFMPRNEGESRTLRDMVKWLSYFSSPSRGSGGDASVDGYGTSLIGRATDFVGTTLGDFGRTLGTLREAINSITFEYPNEFRINYLRIVNGTPEFIFTPIPKTGFIEKLEINYFDEEGTPTSFFRGTAYPTATTIKFTLQENELTIRSDFNDPAEFVTEIAAARLEDVNNVPNNRTFTGEPIIGPRNPPRP